MFTTVLLCFLANSSMLYQAEELARVYEQQTASLPVREAARTEDALRKASVWFALKMDQAPPLSRLADEALWDTLRDIGVEAVFLRGLKESKPAGQAAARIGFGVDPNWGSASDYDQLAAMCEKRGMALAGELIGPSTGCSSDFALALKNVGDYPALYHLIEVPQKDWPLLLNKGVLDWLTVQTLEKKGILPTRKGCWRASGLTTGADSKERRWVYLQTRSGFPLLDWLEAPFAGERLAAADALSAVFHFGQTFLQIDAALPRHARQTAALWIRKLGAFSAESAPEGIDGLKETASDLASDALTRAAVLHALLAEDADALRLIYRLFLDEGIQPKRLIHALQPLDEFSCEWTEFLLHPKKRYLYREEEVTGEILRQRLLKADLTNLSPEEIPFSTWAGLCSSAIHEKGKHKILEAHLLLAFFYAMQPGVFAFSADDLLGALPSKGKGLLDLMGCSRSTLYPSLPNQMRSPHSFASQLRNMLQIRKKTEIALAELIAVPTTRNPGVLILVHKLPNSSLSATCVNFSRCPAEEILEMPGLSRTSAVELMGSLSADKPFGASAFRLHLAPLTGKVLVFQRQYSIP